jgi:3'-5' exonuclease
MFKFTHDELWAIDAEWVPDPDTGRRVYNLDASVDDQAVIQHMWAEGGATEEDPQPYLKTVLCRVVSVSALIRHRAADGSLRLQLYSLPAHDADALPEAELLERLLKGLGDRKPQIVGFNIRNADLPIILQRALAHGVSAPEFCARPNKPWEGIDYFSRNEDWIVDLKDTCGGYGKAAPSLHELASAARIPGKIDVAGGAVAALWEEGEIGRIVAYNEFDAITTYLVWLRAAHLAGHVTTAACAAEEQQLRDLLAQLCLEGRPHLQRYIDKWDQLRAL